MISPPPNQRAFQEDNGKPVDQWVEFFSDVFRAIRTLQTSGTTAQRPTKGLYVGRPYFDTTLGYQIAYNGTVWVDGSGAPV